MKIGIVARTECFGNPIPGDTINYMEHLFHYLRKKNQVVMLSWRDLNKDLTVNKYLFGNNKNVEWRKIGNLNQICDLLFIKQLGQVYESKTPFLDFLSSLERFKGAIVNNPETIISGFSKEYLLRLQEQGIPVIPTKRVTEGISLEEANKMKFEFFGGELEDRVVKPIDFGEMGCAVRQVSSFESEDKFRDFVEKHYPLIIQPYVSEIINGGEISLIFLGKKFVQGVHKHSGEFLVNLSYGKGKTTYRAIQPKEEELEVASRALESWPSRIGYSRVDFIRYWGGSLINEVEVANPAFYVENLPELCQSFNPQLEKFLIEEYQR